NLAVRQYHRLITWVSGAEFHARPAAVKRFERHFTVDGHGRNVAGVYLPLRADDGQVAILNGGFDHTVPYDPNGKIGSAGPAVSVHQDLALPILFRQERYPGRNPAEDRNAAWVDRAVFLQFKTPPAPLPGLNIFFILQGL